MYIPGLCLYRNSEQAGDTQIKAEYSLESMRSDRLGDHYRRRRSIFLKQEKEADFGLGLQAWARIDSYNRSDDLRTAGLNSRYRLSSHNTLSAGLSRNVRLPSFTELYYDDPTTSGSSGLGKEQYLNYQAGLEHQDEVVCYGGIFFLRKEDNPIDWVKHQPDDNRWQAENLADTEVFGSEAFFRLEPDKRFCLSLNYSYADKRRDNRGYLYKYGQSYLRHLAQAAAEIRSAFGEIFIASRYKKKSGRSSWFLAEAGFSRQLNRDLRFFLRVDNLFNQEYQEIEGIPQPGRSLEAGLRAEW
jgi:iron complex outermembrane receptor protein